MIEKLEKISAEMFKQMLKTYSMQEVTKHKKIHHINVNEYCALFPNKGVGFTIQKQTWPEGMHVKLKYAKYKSNRFGHFHGVKMLNDEQIDSHPKRLQGLNKRGIWKFTFGDFEEYTTDNGVTYTRADYEAFERMRAKLPDAEAQQLQRADNQNTEQQVQEEQNA